MPNTLVQTNTTVENNNIISKSTKLEKSNEQLKNYPPRDHAFPAKMKHLSKQIFRAHYLTDAEPCGDRDRAELTL